MTASQLLQPTAQEVLGVFRLPVAATRPLTLTQVAQEVAFKAGRTWDAAHVDTELLAVRLGQLTGNDKLVVRTGSDWQPLIPAHDLLDSGQWHWTTARHYSTWTKHSTQTASRIRIDALKVLAVRHRTELDTLVQHLSAQDDPQLAALRLIRETEDTRR